MTAQIEDKCLASSVGNHMDHLLNQNGAWRESSKECKARGEVEKESGPR